jgi:cytochrome P450
MRRKCRHALVSALASILSVLVLPMADTAQLIDWTSINPYHLIAQNFARIATRVMVGPELCEGRWLTLSRDYINSVTRAPGVVRHKYPAWLRWVAKYIEPTVKAVLKYRREGAELLRPVLEARIAELDNTAPQNGGGKERHERQHEDAIQWLIEEFRSRGKTPTPDAVAQSIYVIMTAAIDSTSSTALWMLFDLLEHPDARAEIREEILRVSGGSPDFAWTRQALGELRVLDSFMRESLRVHSFTQSTSANQFCLVLGRTPRSWYVLVLLTLLNSNRGAHGR